MRGQVEQTQVGTELGALRSRLGKRGVVLRRSASRLVVRFDGETTLTRIRPHLVRVLPTGTGDVAGDRSAAPTVQARRT